MDTSFLPYTSFLFVTAGIIFAVILAFLLYRNRQPMKIMNAVWILTALWASFLAVPAYFKLGFRRDKMMMSAGKNGMIMDMNAERPRWESVALSTLHCGAGCTLADIIGEWVTVYYPIQIAGSAIAGNWVLDFVLALVIGIYFQYFAIRQMEKISATKALVRAAKADFLSLTSWQIGMYGWMALVYFVFFKDHPLEKTSWTFWFMMQLAMMAGFLAAYPMNIFLIKTGIKKGM